MREMDVTAFPAVFHKAEEGGYWVSFPDLAECFTQGEDFEEAYRMAIEVLHLCVMDRKNDGDEITPVKEINLVEGDVVVFVPFYEEENS